MAERIPAFADLYPCLRGLPPELSAELDALKTVRLPEGHSVFERGSPCGAFPLLLAGEIRVSCVATHGRALLLYSVLPGESCVITQGCLLGQRNYNARGVVHAEVELLPLPLGLFERLLSAHAPFRRYVFGIFAERFVDLMALVDEVAFKRLDQRVARLLVEQGPALHTTHQRLADDLGSVREIVTRLLRQFAAEGLVELARESIVVRDPLRLAAMAAADPV